MRVNIYAEEMTDRVEVIAKDCDGTVYTGLRIYLALPVTVPQRYVADGETPTPQQIRGPFMHRPGDDDSSAVTFWGKRDLCEVLRKALAILDQHYTSSDRGG